MLFFDSYSNYMHLSHIHSTSLTHFNSYLRLFFVYFKSQNIESIHVEEKLYFMSLGYRKLLPFLTCIVTMLAVTAYLPLFVFSSPVFPLPLFLICLSTLQEDYKSSHPLPCTPLSTFLPLLLLSLIH